MCLAAHCFIVWRVSLKVPRIERHCFTSQFRSLCASALALTLARSHALKLLGDDAQMTATDARAVGVLRWPDRRPPTLVQCKVHMAIFVGCRMAICHQSGRVRDPRSVQRRRPGYPGQRLRIIIGRKELKGTDGSGRQAGRQGDRVRVVQIEIDVVSPTATNRS